MNAGAQFCAVALAESSASKIAQANGIKSLKQKSVDKLIVTPCQSLPRQIVIQRIKTASFQA